MSAKREVDNGYSQFLGGDANITLFIVDTETDYFMKPGDFVVHVDSTLGAANITLPSRGNAVGHIYSIVAKTGATNAVTLIDNETLTTIGTLSLDMGNVVLYCDGIHWIEFTITNLIP